jgi:hypothetical protein
MKSLWIDDLRPTPEGYTHTARTYKEAYQCLLNEDWDSVSFDHDLGAKHEHQNGLSLMNALERAVYEGTRKAPKTIGVHTANLAAKGAMIQAANHIVKMGNTQKLI